MTGDDLADGLAAFRLTRLIVADEFPPIVWAREKIIERSNSHGKGHLATLITCPYCTGVWVGMGVAVARRVAPRPWRLVGRGLALAAVAAEMSFVDDHLHDGIRVDVGIEDVTPRVVTRVVGGGSGGSSGGSGRQR